MIRILVLNIMSVYYHQKASYSQSWFVSKTFRLINGVRHTLVATLLSPWEYTRLLSNVQSRFPTSLASSECWGICARYQKSANSNPTGYVVDDCNCRFFEVLQIENVGSNIKENNFYLFQKGHHAIKIVLKRNQTSIQLKN